MNGFAKTQVPDDITTTPVPAPSDDMSLQLLVRLAAVAALIAAEIGRAHV